MEGGVTTETNTHACMCTKTHVLRGSGDMLPQENFCESDAVGLLLRPFSAQTGTTIFSRFFACVILHIQGIFRFVRCLFTWTQTAFAETTVQLQLKSR